VLVPVPCIAIKMMKLFFIVIFHVIVVYTLPGKNQKNPDAL
jgi:hypothetical protein